MQRFESNYFVHFWSLLFLLFSQAGCSVFFGNVKPLTEKSSLYEVLDLSTINPDWEKISKKDLELGASDLSFQSKKTKSMISLNSTCKSGEGQQEKQKSLRELTRELLLGFISTPKATADQGTSVEEKLLTLNQVPALKTTVKGLLKGEDIQIQTVVLQYKTCVYDLMYIAKQDFFKTDEKDFERFTTSLKLN